MRYAFIFAALIYVPLALPAGAESHDETPNEETTDPLCPATHYECGTGICCPKT